MPTPYTKPNIALIGCGYWGRNFLRILNNSNRSVLYKVCDTSAERIAQLQAEMPHLSFSTQPDAIINDPAIQAVVLCTPVDTHYTLAKQLLQAGKHVLCEKPLTDNYEQAIELQKLATQQALVLLTGHVFEYHHAVQHMKTLLQNQAIGTLQYMQFVRMGLGPVRNDVNVIFDLAAHDVGMAITFAGQMPVAVSATASGVNSRGLEEVAFIQLEFAGGVPAAISVSWLDPIKQRLVKVVGSKKMLVFDDVSTTEKLKIIETGSGYQSTGGDYGSFQLAVKDGEITIPNLPVSEPLSNEFNHFMDCLSGRAVALTNGPYAANVVRVLQAAQQSLRQGGKKITLP